MISLSFLDYLYKSFGNVYGFSNHICPNTWKMMLRTQRGPNNGKCYSQCFLWARDAQRTPWTPPPSTLVTGSVYYHPTSPGYRKAYRSWEPLPHSQYCVPSSQPQFGSPWGSSWTSSPHQLTTVDGTRNCQPSRVTQILSPGNLESDFRAAISPGWLLK